MPIYLAVPVTNIYSQNGPLDLVPAGLIFYILHRIDFDWGRSCQLKILHELFSIRADFVMIIDITSIGVTIEMSDVRISRIFMELVY